MISNTLPSLLRAISAVRDKETIGEEAMDVKGTTDVSVIVPEKFRMTLSRPVRFETVIRVMKRICHRHNAKLWITEIRKADMNIPPVARVLIKGFRRKAFEAIILVEGDFVSFTSLP